MCASAQRRLEAAMRVAEDAAAAVEDGLEKERVSVACG